ncbi:unnamed protein product [Cercospora beticola]|nr:unnamed protein product [Cercospora beticola]
MGARFDIFGQAHVPAAIIHDRPSRPGHPGAVLAVKGCFGQGQKTRVTACTAKILASRSKALSVFLGQWFDSSTTQAAMAVRWLARLRAPHVRMGLTVTRPQIFEQQ